MAIQKLQRIFKFKDEILPDPGNHLSEKEVKDLYANQYPELVNANIAAAEYEDDKVIYKFETNLGTKG